ncbi:hypothetical protein MBAV_004803, partial [Candidatus Magnetobacterium bavaricum]
MKKLPICISDFRELREGDFFFADKSLLIKDIINDDSKIILLPRPRRFGKTLNLSMLKYFFEKNDSKHETRQFFSELSIEKEHLFQ